MRKIIVLTGGTGMVGSFLTPLLIEAGYHVAVFTRHRRATKAHLSFHEWDIGRGIIDGEILCKAHGVIHLAGENLANKKWSKRQKEEIISSRVTPIQLIHSCLSKRPNDLKVFISASGVGWYGATTNGTICLETETGATDFLGRICTAWESATEPIKDLNIRVVTLRTGIVLAPERSALQKMLPPFVKGFGASLGSGKQYMSWIHINDLCRLYLHSLINDNINGAYNAVTEKSVTNGYFSKKLAKSIGKPMRLPPVPKWILRIILGEMSLLLTEGRPVSNEKVRSTGFTFQYNDLAKALASTIRRS